MYILIIIFYLIGSVTSYLYARKSFSKKYEWTKRDRSFFIFTSIFSWFSVFAIYMTFMSRNNDKANW